MVGWIEAIVGLIVLLVIVAAVLPWIVLPLWLPVKAVLIHRQTKRGLCPKCRAKLELKSWRPSDQMYGSRIEKWECPNGHELTTGNRHYAEW